MVDVGAILYRFATLCCSLLICAMWLVAKADHEQAVQKEAERDDSARAMQFITSIDGTSGQQLPPRRIVHG